MSNVKDDNFVLIYGTGYIEKHVFTAMCEIEDWCQWYPLTWIIIVSGIALPLSCICFIHDCMHLNGFTVCWYQFAYIWACIKCLVVIVTYNPGIGACVALSTGTGTNIQGLDLVNGHCDWFIIGEGPGSSFFYKKVTLYCITLKCSFII